LDVEEHVVFRALASGMVEKNPLDPGAPECLDQQDLIRICACQTIRGMDIEALHYPGGHDIPQALQRRTDQGGPTIPLVNELQGLWDYQTVGRNALPHRRHLTGDGVGFGLLVG
jgi:hypothetical protein